MTTPSTVYLLGCIAEAANSEGNFVGRPPQVCLMGLFDVVEFCPYEPSNYVLSPCFLVAPHGTEDGPYYSVPAEDFDAQVNPKSYARALAQERDMDFHEENEER